MDPIPSYRMRRLNFVKSRVWRHRVIDDVTSRRAVGTFHNAPYWTWTPKSPSFWDI